MAADDVQAAVVIDNGTGTIKAGIAGEDGPSHVFPSLVGRPRVHGGEADATTSPSCYVGHAIPPTADMLASVGCPLSRGIVTDWDDMEVLWNHALHNELRVSPKDHPVFFTEPALNLKSNRERTIQLMFEALGCLAAYISSQPVLSLYASGRTTGIVVDSGEGVTHVAPVYEGYAFPPTSARLELAGGDITQHLSWLLAAEAPASIISPDVAKAVKEKLCYIALDVEEESQKQQENQPTFDLPDGTQLALTQAARFQAPEILFGQLSADAQSRRGSLGCSNSNIISTMYDCIMKSDVDLRKELYSNVVLTGGTTLLEGFADRVARELTALAPSSVHVKTVAPAERQFSAWIGGSILSSLSTFQTMWITREEFDESGPLIVHRKCIS